MLARWFRRSAGVAGALAVAMAAPAVAYAGKLDSVRSEVRGGDSSSSSGSSSSGSSGSSFGDDDDDDDDDGDRRRHPDPWSVQLGPPPPPRPPARFLAFPYQHGIDGYHVRGASDAGPGRTWAANAVVEGAYLYDHVWRGGVNVRMAWVPVEIESRTSYLVEAPGETPVDAMYLGDAAVMFVPNRERDYKVSIGGGVRYMIDGRTPGEGRRDYALGANFGAGFDLFPRRPFIASGRVDVGHLWKAWVVQARATVGVAAGPIEIYAGYDHLQIAKVPLGGPVLGIRGWL